VPKISGRGRRERSATSVEGGSVSVLMVALVVVAAMLVGGIAIAGGLGVAASRAQGAADASALAAAFEARDLRARGGGAVPSGGGTTPLGGDPCAMAGRVATAGGVALTSCVMAVDGSVEVEATDRVAGITVTRRSRAGTS